ncbi:unnamed protein product [Larinioides sclopetarius]|uniref:Uncharacterized protein n=1 Tax=Larinioides sclopetarius TaxID=280406 RepID=A0AAV2B882_9ARAC
MELLVSKMVVPRDVCFAHLSNSDLSSYFSYSR